MARTQHLPPSAACLSASMRDLGYSLEAAVADLIDNSISADASKIDIFCEPSAPRPFLVILDDGRGMDADELLAAMRHGAANPRAERSPRDLGRFGLGLKTASFSQCRSLTVASMKGGACSAAEWDLDVIDKTDDWILSILDDKDIAALPYMDRLGTHGTAVIWRELDRLLEDETGNRRDEIVNEKLDVLEKHLSLVFHRFLAGEIRVDVVLRLLSTDIQSKPLIRSAAKTHTPDICRKRLCGSDRLQCICSLISCRTIQT
ncbi:ATP-binding protein [Rhizobium sp. 28DA2]|uniref:ATP-binding protein n=1 Tax=Rhizobium sp. 28DA2 TaxID=3035209 RepID=UPI002B2541C8|nr:ATP-binding protein [Rhizobium sp. 28DA2]